MALTNNNLEIIKALAHNDLYTARKAALASLIEDKTKKNEWAVNYYKKMLIGNASVLMSNLPNDMQTVLVGETPNGFNADRYYIRETEQRVIDDIIKMKLISEELSLRNIPYKNTTLLYGVSGTGKTELGRYIAYRLNLPFFYISFVSTIDSYMGSTAKNIHKVFDFCNSIPCVLMLDEVDCVATKRSSGGSKGPDGELERTTISLMQELDKLPNHVTLIAATNRLDMVDEAFLRRFSIKHEVTNMTGDDLRNLVKKFLSATDTEQYFSEESIEKLVQNYENPGQVMPILIRELGKAIFEEKKDELLAKADNDNNDNNDNFNLWEVTYKWVTDIAAETEEDAIAIARNKRYSYGVKPKEELYTAQRAEFLVPQNKGI